VTAAVDAGHVVLQVRDTGIGIAPDMLPRVFDLFVQEGQTLARSRGGLGLGLAIVRSLVTLHGGTVSADSEGPGCGSTFTIRLPQAALEAPLPAAGPCGAGPVAAAPGQVRVLVVDDNADAAELLAELLTDLGFETTHVHDAPEALVRAAQFRPDVALVDIGLPVMDGYELARRLSADPHLQGLRLVAVTGYGQHQDRQRSAEAGFHAHLVKPVDPEQLRQALGDLAAPLSSPAGGSRLEV
jgi:CheY-like chemotaxis protein